MDGPFTILSAYKDNTVTIQRQDHVERVSANRVACAPKSVRPLTAAGPHAATSTDLAAKSQSGCTWVLDQTTSHRECDDVSLEFRVKWGGGWRPTWEPRTNLPEEAVTQCLVRRARAARLSTDANSPVATDANTAVLGVPLIDPYAIHNPDTHDAHSDIPDLSRPWLPSSS